MGVLALKGRKRRRIILSVIAAAGLSVIWMETCCIPPTSMKAVKDPRGGRPLGNRVAIIYSKHYQMNMAGLEGLQ